MKKRGKVYMFGTKILTGGLFRDLLSYLLWDMMYF